MRLGPFHSTVTIGPNRWTSSPCGSIHRGCNQSIGATKLFQLSCQGDTSEIITNKGALWEKGKGAPSGKAQMKFTLV